jgi:1,4-dihydroxy-2-naphthoate octaprenyltransferase
MKTLRAALLSLVVGGLFGWALSTKFPVYIAALSGTAAAAFMHAGSIYNERVERRQTLARRAVDPDEAA